MYTLFYLLQSLQAFTIYENMKHIFQLLVLVLSLEMITVRHLFVYLLVNVGV